MFTNHYQPISNGHLSSGFSLKAFINILLFFALLFSGSAFAQTVKESKLSCDISKRNPCTSKDLEVVSVTIVAPACETCTPGDEVEYPLKMTIHNGTGSVRTSFSLYGNLTTGASINGVSGKIFVCVGPITVTKGDQTFDVGKIKFTCGQALSLTDNFLAWTDAAGNTTDRCDDYSKATKCSDIAPKCGTADNISIVAPLSATAQPGVQPCTNSTATNGSIKVDPAGGKAPYKIYCREKTTTNCPATAPTGTPDATSQAGEEVTVSSLGDGTYCIYVVDANNCLFPVFTQEIGQPCCVNPTAPTVCEVPASICGNGKVTLRLSSLASNAEYYVVYQTGGYRDTINVSDADNGTLTFTGLTPGGGFNAFGVDSVSATSVCYGDTTTCNTNGFTGTCEETSINARRTEVQSVDMIPQQTRVLAAPNPFNDRIRFTLESDITGQGTLELYNIMGQKVKTVYQGYIEKGKSQNIEYSVPISQRSALIYIFRVGDQRASGKLVGLKQ